MLMNLNAQAIEMEKTKMAKSKRKKAYKIVQKLYVRGRKIYCQ